MGGIWRNRRSWLLASALVLALALINGVIWAGERRGLERLVYFDVPLTPYRSLHVHIDPRSSYHESNPFPIYQPMTSQPDHAGASSPLRIEIWYKQSPAGVRGARRQVLSTAMPHWPVSALPSSAVLVVGALGVAWFKHRRK